MDTALLSKTAAAMVAKGKGILAADESRRHLRDALQVDQRRMHRGEPPRVPRPALHHAGHRAIPRGRDPVRRDAAPEDQRRRAVRRLPGEEGHHSRHQGRCAARRTCRSRPGEKVTEGLDGLRQAPRRVLQARRALRQVARGDHHRRRHSLRHTCIYANAHALARYAALCQEASIVPIVEPEVLLDGDHTIERCEEVTEATLRATYRGAAPRTTSRSST